MSEGASLKGLLPSCINSQPEEREVRHLAGSVMSAHVLGFILSLMKPKSELSRSNFVHRCLPSFLGFELTEVLIEGKRILQFI